MLVLHCLLSGTCIVYVHRTKFERQRMPILWFVFSPGTSVCVYLLEASEMNKCCCDL